MARYESASTIAIMGVQSCVQCKRNNPEQEIAAGFFYVPHKEPLCFLMNLLDLCIGLLVQTRKRTAMSYAQDDFYTLITKAAEPHTVLREPVEEGQLPAMPYLLFSMTQGHPGPSHHGRVNEAGIRQVSAHYQAQLQLRCFATDSWNILERVHLALESESLQALSEELNIAVVRAVLSEVEPDQAEQGQAHTRLDLDVLYTASMDDEVHVIEFVEVKGGQPPA
jgi:hypothetical protein